LLERISDGEFRLTDAGLTKCGISVRRRLKPQTLLLRENLRLPLWITTGIVQAMREVGYEKIGTSSAG